MKKLSITIIVLSTLFLQGCTKSIKKSPEKLSEQPPKMLKFQRCITDAKTLSQLDNKYEKDTKELYALVNNAKFYASIADESSTNVSSTITPFFDYKLNEICNGLSIMLIEEFQKNTITAISKDRP
ncbi:hypothetical protein HV127_28400 [Klebsiella sp. RHBSTW-00215]|uniref:hypothetical protein n=1 Tax=Klebsiella sp. RHBSTW-00215 TaxID=2742640 RepID=UPI0015F4C8B0|nr:hypothetical protein [Klebsiella sp. RHBSTW-00215]MBA7935125.1 hypothetical protein [Klebsiella sp. RHBSTW-00215]